MAAPEEVNVVSEERPPTLARLVLRLERSDGASVDYIMDVPAKDGVREALRELLSATSVYQHDTMFADVPDFVSGPLRLAREKAQSALDYVASLTPEALRRSDTKGESK